MAEEGYSGKLVWFVAGAAVGAAIALLYAPATGEETRKYIGKKTKQGREAIAETGRDMIEKGRELYERGRRMADEAAEMFDRGKKIVERAADSATS